MKIICFSSYTSLWFYAFAEAIIANALQKSGHEVLFITPGRDFPGRSKIENERILRRQFNLKGYELAKILTKKDYLNIESILANLNKGNFQDLFIDGVNIGKISLYEFLLHHKKMSSDLTDREWDKCLIEIRATLISFFACRAVIRKENPDKVIMYNNLYSVNHVWEELATAVGISTYFLGNGGNLWDMKDTLVIGKNNTIYFLNRLIEYWSDHKQISISSSQAQYITNHFLELIKAKNGLVYSTPKSKHRPNLRKIFGIRQSQTIITAIMSSNDEMFAAEYIGVKGESSNLIFSSQIEWMQKTIEYVKKKPKIFLIIRVHPREFPNSRVRGKSDHAKQLEKILINLPKNVRVNWPTDKISLYDLAEETSVFLNAWSSVGVEMSLLGIPVVIYSKDLIMYPSDLNYLADSKIDYYRKIELALSEGWSYERIRMAYRWLTLHYEQTIIKYRESRLETKISTNNMSTTRAPKRIYSMLPPAIKSLINQIYLATIQKAKNKDKLAKICRMQLSRRINISRLEKMLRKNANSLVDIEHKSATKVSKQEEDKYIRHELARICRVMYDDLSTRNMPKVNSLRHHLLQATKSI